MRIFKNLLFTLLVLSLMACNKKKETTVTCKEWQPIAVDDSTNIDPFSLEQSTKCGTLNLWAGEFPKSLNMWLDYNSFSAEITQLLYYPLLTLHPESSEPVALIAQSWTISEDQKEFVFKLDPKAKWSDGKSITAEDVQYYYDVLMDPKNMTPIFKVDLKRFKRPEIIDSLTIKITALEYHWKNFIDVGGFVPLPKHILASQDFNKVHYEFPVSSGPYKIGELKKDRYLKMERDTKWWGDHLLFNKNKYNFSELKYRFMEDRTKALEAIKKGDFDILQVYTSSLWATQTDFDQVKKNWIVKQQVYNQQPIGFQGLALNLRKEKFQDKRVRQALAYLLNREQMNEKLMYNAYFLLNSYYPDLYKDNVNPNKELVKYDPEKARALLKEAGYKVDDAGVLKKDGKAFEIVFYSAASDLRHLTIYLEDLKKVGIQASIEKMTWSSIRKKLDEHDFDMYWSAWGSSRFKDPEGIWSTSQINEKGTNNIPGFGNAQVDKWIKELRSISDLKVRDSLVKAIDSILVDEIPYVLLWQNDNARMLYWNRFDMPKSVFSRYGDATDAVTYWSVNLEKEKALKEAKTNDTSLKAEAAVVKY